MPFWEAKFAQNVARDARDIAALTAAGWEVVVVWECQLRDQANLDALVRRIKVTPRHF